MSDRPEPEPGPVVGAWVVDARTDRVGQVMGHEGPYVQLRPPGGGREWDVPPGDVRPASVRDTLRARVGERNWGSRLP